MKYIALSKGYSAIVDDADFDVVSQYKWTALVQKDGRVYAYRKAENKTVYLHRFITGAVDKRLVVDHINHDCLDNRRGNLRCVTQSQNLFNAKAKTNAKSIFKGVSWSSQKNKWRVSIVNSDRKRMHIGFYKDEGNAAQAYKEAAMKLHGEYMCINSEARQI